MCVTRDLDRIAYLHREKCHWQSTRGLLAFLSLTFFYTYLFYLFRDKWSIDDLLHIILALFDLNQLFMTYYPWKQLKTLNTAQYTLLRSYITIRASEH